MKIFRPWKARLLVVALVAAVLLLPVYVEMRTAGALLNVKPPIETVGKSDVALDETEDIKKGAEKANVLIMLDVGSPMTFTANGTMPEWGANATTRDQVNTMLAGSTYGHGGLPVLGATATNTNPRTRYGREVDASNNMTTGNTNLVDHLNNYYSPFDYANNSASQAFGRGAEAAPYALVFRNPAYWRTGKAGAISANDLVPNDSRMYKMKLVMWRILSDTVLIENLRLGMATTFQEMNGPSTAYGADFYRSGPLDNPSVSTWIPAGGAAANWTAPGYGMSNPNFPNGNAPSWATGIANSDNFNAGQGYYQAASAFMGIDRDYYDYAHNTLQWKLMNRASLHVPIEEYSEAHINKFRTWIDGLENIAVKTGAAAGEDAFYYTNPELFGDGKTYLSTAIYPGHSDLTRNQLVGGSAAGGANDYTSKGGVVFSSRDTYTIMSMNANFNLANANGGTLIGNFFRQNSGEALGTVLDFFSPPRAGYGGMNYSAYNLSKAPASNFPLKDPCENNWVIIFTAGDDSGSYSSANAVRDLYNYTKNNPLTRHTGISGGNNTFNEIRLQDGVRTLVVGFVDPRSAASANLRAKLNAMAQAGDPGCEPKDADGNYAFFANDVEGLIGAMRKVLARINSDIQPAKGSMLEGDSIDGDSIDGFDRDSEEMFNLYSASYRINIYDQWEGKVSKYVTAKDNTTGQMRTDLSWEAGRKLLSGRETLPAGTSRNLVFWSGAGNNGKNYEKLEYTALNATGYRNQHPDMTNYGINLIPPIASMDNTVLAVNTNWNLRMNPSRALINWYHGYETSYGYSTGQDMQYNRRYMLTDLGNSGIAKGGPPPVQNSLPGYRAYADDPSRKALPHKLYFQTNDGLLHVLDAKTGNEDMAILPPPSLLNYRLFGLKTTHEKTTDRYRWINVDDYLTTTSDDIPITSQPSFTLDGPVQRFYMDMSGQGTDWTAKLVATLGHAGGGIYVMDVSAPATPAFQWYREMYEDENRQLHLYRLDKDNFDGIDPHENTYNGADQGLWEAVTTSGDHYPFYQLGFNSPKPHFGVASHESVHTDPDGHYNIIALGGGAQNYLDLNRNGTVGAAFYLIDPDVRYHSFSTAYPTPGIRVFNSGSVANAPSAWRSDGEKGANIPNPYMGMVVSEPIFFASQDSNYVARGVFTADNRGNIFYVSFVDYSTGQSLGREDWEIRTIATLRASGDDPTDSYALPLGVVAGSRIDRSDKWVAGGTSNVGTKGKTDSIDTMIHNKDQLIFSFKLPEMADKDSPDYGMTRRREWTSLSAADGGDGIDPGDKGWYIELERAGASYNDEYVTTAPLMLNGKLYIATFQEMKYESGSAACDTGQKNGRARLYTVAMDTGRAGMWNGGNDKYLQFDGIKITGFTHSEKGQKETLIATYELLNIADAASSIHDAVESEESVSSLEGMNALLLTNVGGSVRTTSVTSNDQVVNYWRFLE
ncbi:MAG: hypothetical protein LBL73_01360 [Synergistaceae bacterium]|nr:hypothetical protein [Synergistaceae bacterium]